MPAPATRVPAAAWRQPREPGPPQAATSQSLAPSKEADSPSPSPTHSQEIDRSCVRRSVGHCPVTCLSHSAREFGGFGRPLAMVPAQVEAELLELRELSLRDRYQRVNSRRDAPAANPFRQTPGCPTLSRVRCSGPTAASRPQPRHEARGRQERHDQRDHDEIRGGDDALVPIDLRLGRRKLPRLGLSQRQPGGRRRPGWQRLVGGVQIRSFGDRAHRPAAREFLAKSTVRPIGVAVELYAPRRSRKRLESGHRDRQASAQHLSRSG